MRYNDRMMIVGLTGGIGSGKSTVAELFAGFGVPVIDTDVIARELVVPCEPAYHAIVKHFGKGILTANQELDRTALKQRILNDDHQRQALENILHPVIHETVAARLQQLDSDYCIVVIPLLVEKARYTMLDRILVVDTPVAEQIARISQRDGADTSTIEKLIAIQASRDERLARADDVILNDQGLPELTAATRQLHDKYMNLCNKMPESPS